VCGCAHLACGFMSPMIALVAVAAILAASLAAASAARRSSRATVGAFSRPPVVRVDVVGDGDDATLYRLAPERPAETLPLGWEVVGEVWFAGGEPHEAGAGRIWLRAAPATCERGRFADYLGEAIRDTLLRRGCAVVTRTHEFRAGEWHEVSDRQLRRRRRSW